MAEQKEKPAHVQVAEAGFGAAVEAKGFRKVGRTHWRLDGDGIVHHVRLNKGYTNIPSSFRDAYGFDYPEFWKLAERCGYDRYRDKLPGTSIEIHGAADDALVSLDRSVQLQDWINTYGDPNERSLRSLFRDLFRPAPDFNTSYYREPSGQKKNLQGGGRFDAKAWILNGLTVEELARSISECWQRGHWHIHGRHTSFQSYYECSMREIIANRIGFLEDHLIYAFMGSDLHLIQRMADQEIERLGPSIEDHHERIYDRCANKVARVDWKIERDTQAGWRAIRDSAMSSHARPRRYLIRIREMADALGIEVRTPHIDPTPVKAWEQRIEERMAGIDYDSRLHPG